MRLLVVALVALAAPITAGDNVRLSAPAAVVDSTVLTKVEALESAVTRVGTEVRTTRESLCSQDARTSQVVSQQQRSLSDSRFLYLLSAAAQALASILTLVFTVTLVVAQLTTTYGIHLAQSAFGVRNMLKMGIFVSTTVFSLVALFWPNWISGLACIVLTSTCMVVLLVHFRSMRKELDIVAAIARIRSTAESALGPLSVSGERPSVDTRCIDQLETISYQAANRFDFVTASAAVKAMVSLSGPLVARGLDDESLDVKERIKRMALQMRGQPKSVSVILQGFVDGTADAGDHAFVRLRAQTVEVLEALIQACDWPRDEETVVAVFEVAGRLLERVSYIITETQMLHADDASYVMNHMTHEWQRVVKPDDQWIHGRGRAATVLHATYCKLARFCSMAKHPDRDCINSAVQHALQLLNPRYGEDAFGAATGYVSHRTIATITEVAAWLEESVIVPTMESARFDYANWSSKAVTEWWQFAASLLEAPQARLVHAALGKLTGAMAHTEAQAGEGSISSTLKSIGASAEPLVSALGNLHYAATQSLFHAVAECRKKGQLETSDVVNLIVAFSATTPAMEGRTAMTQTLWSTSNALVDTPIVIDEQGNRLWRIEPDVAYCWLLSAALFLKWHRTLPPQAGPHGIVDLPDIDPKRAALRSTSDEVWTRAAKEKWHILPDLRYLYETLRFPVPEAGISGTQA